MRRILDLCLVWRVAAVFACVCPRLAMAAHYEYYAFTSGNDLRIVGSNGQPWRRALTINGNQISGGAGSSNQQAPNVLTPGEVSIDDVLVMLIIWSPDFTGDSQEPPSSIVVHEFSSVGAEGTSVATSDGLGDPSFTSGWSSISEGDRYTVYNNYPDFIEITCSVSCSASTPVSTVDNLGAFANVFYSVNVTPVDVVPNGAIYGRPNSCETGQGIQMEVLSGPYLAHNHNWFSIGTSFFTRVEWGPQRTSRKQFGIENPEWRTTPTIDVWYDKPSPNPYLIACSLDLYAPDNSSFIGHAIAETQLEVLGPECNLSVWGMGPTVFLPHSYNAQIIRAGNEEDPLPENQDGIQFMDVYCHTTPLFVNLLGSGEWSFVQLLELHRTLEFAGLFPDTLVVTGPKLDNGWPYAGPTFTVPPYICDATDSPANGLVKDPFGLPVLTGTSVSIADTYYMIAAYMPPQHPNGIANEYVGVRMAPWYWNTSGHRVLPSLQWFGPFGPGVQDDGQLDFPSAWFEWDGSFSNNQ